MPAGTNKYQQIQCTTTGANIDSKTNIEIPSQTIYQQKEDKIGLKCLPCFAYKILIQTGEPYRFLALR